MEEFYIQLRVLGPYSWYIFLWSNAASSVFAQRSKTDQVHLSGISLRPHTAQVLVAVSVPWCRWGIVSESYFCNMLLPVLLEWYLCPGAVVFTALLFLPVLLVLLVFYLWHTLAFIACIVLAHLPRGPASSRCSLAPPSNRPFTTRL